MNVCFLNVNAFFLKKVFDKPFCFSDVKCKVLFNLQKNQIKQIIAIKKL